MSNKHYPLIRTIYLYLFALVGLAMMIVGTARLVDLGMKEYVFHVDETSYYYERPMPVMPGEKASEMSAEEKEKYKKEQLVVEKKRAKERKKKDLSEILSLIIVGLPVWMYHWRIIQRDIKHGGDK